MKARGRKRVKEREREKKGGAEKTRHKKRISN
jgi:hypothetical protein